MTLGLLLVALSEEMLFRRMLVNMLNRFTARALPICLISSLIFGLIHWESGLQNVLAATLIGCYLMWIYLRTGSFLTIVAIHYVINLWVFYLR